jgi:hypothetical protein
MKRKNYTFDDASLEVLSKFNNHSEVLRLLIASLNPLSNREGIKERLKQLKK